jgi:alpha-mannosidase
MVDPFGHSSTMARLYAQMGYDGHVIARIPYLEKALYKEDRSMQRMWNPDPRTFLYTHILEDYLYPTNLRFGRDMEFLDFTLFPTEETDAEYKWRKSEEQVMARALDFYLSMRAQLENAYDGNILLQPMGDDFSFTFGNREFANLDAYLSIIKSNPHFYPNLNISFTTLSRFLKVIAKTDKKFYPIKKDDFFPYEDNIDDAWTGYFSTNPVMKFRTRMFGR